MEGDVWHTTDLFLDVWWPAGGEAEILDEDELDEAFGREQIDPETAARAREEAARLIEGARAGTWPPPVVREWTLERALAELSRAG
jgi:predicted RNA-binding protein associated with RNAse of E/G family